MGRRTKRIAMLGAAAALALAAQAGIAQTAPEGYGDFVWNDHDQNGIQNAGEIGIANVLVSLFRSDSGYTTAITTTMTDPSGHYFLNIGSGGANFSYIIQFALPTGFAFSPADQGGNDALDSDVTDAATGRTDIRHGFNFPCCSGGGDMTVDAGMYQLTTIPEPGTLALLSAALGLAGFASRTRRR
jgi:serine-aspartate repeat-containing protein C/D/E